jgi:UDP-N-acetyl-D-glucosamine dehydrogenase
VPEIRLETETLHNQPCDTVKTADCVVIVTDHAAFDYKVLLEQASLIVDTRNAMRGVVSDKVVRL